MYHNNIIFKNTNIKKMRKILKLILLILIMMTAEKSYSQTVNIGIQGTNIGNSVDLRFTLTAVGGNFSLNAIVFSIKTPSYSSITYGEDSLFNGITHYIDETGTSGAHYREYNATTLTLNINNGTTIQILRINASAPAPTSFEIPTVNGDGLYNIAFYAENGGLEVTGIASPQTYEAPMPVELNNFNSIVTNNSVQLNWSTSKEINNKGFFIERAVKSDVLQWSQLSFLEGKNGNGTNNYNYTDKKLETGKYNYRLKQCDYNGNSEYFYLKNDVEVSVPKKFEVSQNYPNPFNPMTNIDYQLPYDSKVTLIIFDMLGREIVKLIDQEFKAGYYSKSFDASNISSGIYFYRLIADSPGNKFIVTKKMMVIK